MHFSSAYLVAAAATLSPYFTQAQVNTIASGWAFSCATGTAQPLNYKDAMVCWGRNEDMEVSGIPKDQIGQPPRTGGQLSAGSEHVCYLTARDVGDLYCWGRSDISSIPSNLEKGVQLLAAGGNHTCVSQYDEVDYQKVYCWGSTDNSSNTSKYT